MGCAAQIHEKTDKQGAWSYVPHTGQLIPWHLFRAPQNAQMLHVIYPKQTSHRHNAAESQAHHATRGIVRRKIMHAIAAHIKSIKAENSSGSDEQTRQLKQLESLAGRTAAQGPAIKQQIQAVHAHASSKGLATGTLAGHPQQMTRPMTAEPAPSPRAEALPPKVGVAAAPRVRPAAAATELSAMQTSTQQTKQHTKLRAADRLATSSDTPVCNICKRPRGDSHFHGHVSPFFCNISKRQQWLSDVSMHRVYLTLFLNGHLNGRSVVVQMYRRYDLMVRYLDTISRLRMCLIL